MAEPDAQFGTNPTQVAAFLNPNDPDVSYDPSGRLRLRVKVVQPPPPEITPQKKGSPAAKVRPPEAQPPKTMSIEDAPEYVDKSVPPAAAAAPGQPVSKPMSIEDAPPYVDTSVPMQPEREVSRGQAVAQGVGAAIPFSSAIQGLQAAAAAPGGDETKQGVEQAQQAVESVNPFSYLAKKIGLPQDHETLQGLARLFQRGGDQPAQEAYVQGRDTAQETQDLAAKQHPGFFYPATVATTLALPVPGGAAAGAGRAANAYRMAKTGAALGGVYGVSEGVNRGQDLPEIAARGAVGAGAGFALGGSLGAILPGAAVGPSTRGQRATQTAEEMGGSIPKGLASDRPWLNTFTAGLKSFPWAGARVSSQVADVEARSGNRLHDIATTLTGGPIDRASTGAAARTGADTASENVTKIIRQSYKNVFDKVDQTTKFPMPGTQAALRQIKADRVEKGWKDPGLGLEQWENVSEEATVKGAQGARSEAGAKGGGINPHPGFDKGHYNLLTKAMTDDLRANVYAAAHGDAAAKQAALDAFDRADRLFGPFSEFNRFLRDIAEDNGESAISRLMSTAQEKTGDLTLLSQLRATMPPDAFNQIGGQILHELGNQQGQFSLAKFVTEYEKLSPKARDLLFSPQHREDIEKIFEMGVQIKGALKTANTSHTAAPLILMDIARDAVMTGAAVAAGALSAGSVAGGAALAAPAVVFTHWVSSPATARAISNWTTAYRVATLGQPTPARIAAFKIATRNLAHNLNVPVENVTRAIESRLPTAAQPSTDNKGPKVPGPVQQ